MSFIWLLINVMFLITACFLYVSCCKSEEDLWNKSVWVHPKRMFTHKHCGETMEKGSLNGGPTDRHAVFCVCVCYYFVCDYVNTHTYTHSPWDSWIHRIAFQRTSSSNINLGHGQLAKSHIGVLSTSHTHRFQNPWPEMTGLICPTARVISLRLCVWEMRRAQPLISLPFPDPKDWQI